MHRLSGFLALCFAALGLASCNFVGISTSDALLTFVNRADEPFAVIVFDNDDLPLIDPMPALSSEEFAERMIGPGESAAYDENTGYERGDDAAVLIYAKYGCRDYAREMVGPDCAQLVRVFTVTAPQLVATGYRVTVERIYYDD